MKAIYLCGGMQALSDSEAADWRNYTIEKLGNLFKINNPMIRDYRNKPTDSKEIYSKIVLDDLKDIKESDYILVKTDKPSWGTAMEIVYSYLFKKTIISFNVTKNTSPWVLYHSNYKCDSLDEAIELLKELESK